jgi:hypothetical protein
MRAPLVSIFAAGIGAAIALEAAVFIGLPPPFDDIAMIGAAAMLAVAFGAIGWAAYRWRRDGARPIMRELAASSTALGTAGRRPPSGAAGDTAGPAPQH